MSYVNIVGAQTVTPVVGKGILKSVVINQPIASGTITIYDNSSASNPKIATITLPAALLGQGPQGAVYDTDFGTGLTIVTTGTNLDVTVSWR